MQFIRWALLALLVVLGVPPPLYGQALASPYNLALYPTQSATGPQRLATIQLNGLVTPSLIGASFNSGSVTIAGTGLTTVTFSVFGSFDNGATFYALPLNVLGSPASTATSITATSNGVWQFPLTNVSHIYVITTGTFTAASVAFSVNASPNGIIARNGGGGGGGAVASVFGRTGVVVAANGDYSFSQINGTLSASQISGTVVSNGVAYFNSAGSAAISNAKFLIDGACGLASGNNAGPLCQSNAFNVVGATGGLNPYGTYYVVSGSSGSLFESPYYGHLDQHFIVDESAGGYQDRNCVLYKGGVGDFQCLTMYWGGNAGDAYGSDQGEQGLFMLGGEAPGSTFSVGSYASNILTMTAFSNSCNPGNPGTQLAFQPCLPSVGNQVIDTQSGGIAGHLISASTAPPSPMSAATWLKQIGTAGASLPVSSVYGYALSANLTPNTTLDVPVSQTVHLGGGVGTFTSGGGDPVCVFGNGFNEESVTTSASGSSPTQTLILPLTRNNVSVAIFKGHCGILSWDATYNLPNGPHLRTDYPSVSIDGTNAIYNITAYGQGGFLTLPQTFGEPEVVAPVFATTHAYTVGDFAYDGTGVQMVTVAGTSGGSAPTWNHTTVGDTTVSGGATFRYRGLISNFHYFVAATVAKANNVGTALAPQWTFTLQPNGTGFAAGHSGEAINYPVQTTQGIYDDVQCLTVGGCNAGIFQTHGMGSGGSPSNSVIQINNLGIEDYYFDSANLSTGITPPNAIDFNIIVGLPGIFSNYFAMNLAPVDSVININDIRSGQTSFYLIRPDSFLIPGIRMNVGSPASVEIVGGNFIVDGTVLASQYNLGGFGSITGVDSGSSTDIHLHTSGGTVYLGDGTFGMTVDQFSTIQLNGSGGPKITPNGTAFFLTTAAGGPLAVVLGANDGVETALSNLGPSNGYALYVSNLAGNVPIYMDSAYLKPTATAHALRLQSAGINDFSITFPVAQNSIPGTSLCFDASGVSIWCNGGGTGAATAGSLGSGLTSVTCISADCSNLRGTLSVVGGTFTTGVLFTMTWPTTTTPYTCQFLQNGGATSFGISNDIPNATSVNVRNSISVTGSTFVINYSCQR